MTYVPWDKVKPEELEGFCEGGMLDSDTLNPGNTMLVYAKSRRVRGGACDRCFFS